MSLYGTLRVYIGAAGLLALIGFAGAVGAADPDKRHPHQGIVEPFSQRPPVVELDPTQRARLEAGELLLVSVEGRDGGRGMAIQDIAAPPAVVWDRIGAFDEYPHMVDHVEECAIYHSDGDDVRVRFVLSVMTLDYEYYIRHVFRPEEGYVTWTLDYTRESDLDDSVGYWAVLSHPTHPGWSRLFYSIDMRTRGWIPGFVRRMLAKQGLHDATAWVKRESEALHAENAAAAGPG